LGGVFGGKAEYLPTKREPLDRIILMDSRKGDSNRGAESMRNLERKNFSCLSDWTAFYTPGSGEVNRGV
jgi:hypothetical protein